MKRPCGPTRPGQAERANLARPEKGVGQRYANGRGRTIAIFVCGEIFWLLLIGLVHSDGVGTKLLLAVLSALVLLLAIRCGFSFVLVLTPEYVTTRTLTRTRRWRYEELRTAQLSAGSHRRSNRRVVTITPRLGCPHQFPIPEDDPESPSAFDAAVEEINTRIFFSHLQATFVSS
jgi:hypothetical protein